MIDISSQREFISHNLYGCDYATGCMIGILGSRLCTSPVCASIVQLRYCPTRSAAMHSPFGRQIGMIVYVATMCSRVDLEDNGYLRKG